MVRPDAHSRRSFWSWLRPSSLRRGLLIGAMAVALVALPGRVSAQPISETEKAEVLSRAEKVVRSRAYASTADFTKWPELLGKYKDELDRADTVPAFSRVMNRLMNEFGISHFDMLTPKMAEQRRQTSQVGIGVRHDGREPFRNGLTILDVIEDGPASIAGLKDNDVILEVDGKPLTEGAQLKGEEGSKIVLTIRRAGSAEGVTEKVEVTRGKFRTKEPETFAKLGEDASFIRIPSFDTSYDRRRIEGFVKQAVDSKYLIIDLRNNGGGATTNLQHFLSMFLAKGTEFGTQVDRETADKYHEETGKDASDVVAVAEWSRDKWKIRRNPSFAPFKGKVAVLINRASASASEIAAAALKELMDPPAVLLGGPTAGAVLVANDVALPDGFRMMVPISEYVTIKGRRLEGNPLRPDVQMGGRGIGRVPEKEEIVQRALEELRAK